MTSIALVEDDLDDLMAEPVRTRTDGTPLFTWGSELSRDPALLEPPPVVLPWLAWRERTTLFAAPEKAGKSTLMGQAVAAFSRGGDFLGRHCGRERERHTAWICIDEPIADCYERLYRFGADLSRVAFIEERLTEVEWREALVAIEPQLVVIDTLTEWAAGKVESFRDARAWQPILAQLRRDMKDMGSACVLLHHMTREGNRYADSRQLGAGVDAIVEMTGIESEPALRRLAIRARRAGHSTLQLRYGTDRYHLEAPERSLIERVYLLIEGQPGIGKRRVRECVGGGKDSVDRAIADLLNDGLISSTGKGLCAVAPESRPATAKSLIRHGAATPEDGGEESVANSLPAKGRHASATASATPDVAASLSTPREPPPSFQGFGPGWEADIPDSEPAPWELGE